MATDKTANMDTRVSVSGEKAYKEACRDINKNLALINSEMKLVTAEYKNNENSTEALRAKQELLHKTYDEQAKKVEAAKKELEKYEGAEKKNVDAIQKAQKELNYQKAALANTNNAIKENEKALTMAEKATSAGAKAQERYKETCKNIDQNLNVLNAGLQEINAKYTENANNAKAVTERQEILKKTYDEQARKVEETRKAYESIKKEYGENSQEAKELEAQLHREKAALYEVDNQIKETEKSHGDFGSTLSGAVTAACKMAVTALAAIGTAALTAGKKLYDMATDTAAAGDKVDKASQKVGLSAEAYQKWDYAMNLAGTSMDTCKNGLKKLTDTIDDANTGNKTAIERFKRLGISVDDLKGKSREDIFGMTITALQNVSDETERAALANDIFGKSGSELAPLLNQGAEATTKALQEAEKYGMVMSNEAVAASAAFCDAQSKLQGTFSGVKNRITSDMLPSLTLVMNGLSDLVIGEETAGEEIKQGITGIIGSISNMIPQVLGIVTNIADAVLEGAPMIMQALAQGIIDALPRLLPTVTKVVMSIATMIIQLLPQVLQAGTQVLISLASGIGSALPTLLPAVVDVVANIAMMLVSNVPMLLDAALQLVTGLADGVIAALPVLIEALPEVITTMIDAIVEGLPLVIASAGDIMVALVDGVIAALPLLIAAMPQIILAVADGIVKGLPKVLGAAGRLVETIINKIEELPTLIWDAITDGINKVAEWGVRMKEKGGTVTTELVEKIIGIIKELPQKIWNAITGAVTKIATWGVNMSAKAGEVMGNMVTGAVAIVKELPQKIWNGITGAVGRVAEWGASMSAKAGEVMGNMAAGVANVVRGIPQRIWDGIIGAVSKVAAWGTNMKNTAVGGMWDVINGITGVFWNIGGTFAGFGRNIVEGIWNGISNGTQWIKDKISGWVGNVTSFLKKLFGINSPSKLMRDEVGVFLAKGIGVGFEDEMDAVNKQIEAAIPREFDVGAKVSVGRGVTYDPGDDGNPDKPRPRGATPITVIQNIYANTTDYVKQQKEAARQLRMVARTV